MKTCVLILTWLMHETETIYHQSHFLSSCTLFVFCFEWTRLLCVWWPCIDISVLLSHPQVPPTSVLHLSHVKILPTSKWHHSSVPVCCCRKQDHHSFQKKWVKIWLSCETRTIIACTQMCLAGLREGSDQEVVTCWSICDQDYNRCLFDLRTTVTQVIISFRGCQTLQWVT